MKSNHENGEELQIAKALKEQQRSLDWLYKTIILLNIAVIGGLLKFTYDFNREVTLIVDTPTKNTMEWVREYVKHNAPYTHDRQSVEARLRYHEKQLEDLQKDVRQLERGSNNR